MIKSKLSKKAIELAEADGWHQYGFSDWKRGEKLGNGCFIDYGSTTQALILMYRSEAKKEVKDENI